ncbi:MAG TPA: hypothetical protein VJ454_00810, partial [Steroidobacteraceae bacterium]|nr:hypothetical protein [Steroidobacteraceae bacterium]
MTASARGTIFLERARVISQVAHDAQQFVLRVAAPRCAAHAQPGSFAHITCDAAIPMRRPLSIMRAEARAGWIEMLYKALGPGLHALAGRKVGEEVSVLGPIGRPFMPHPERPRTLLLGGGVGIPPMVFLAERLREAGGAAWKPLVLMGSEVPFPFRTRPSRLIVPGIPAGAIACM